MKNLKKPIIIIVAVILVLAVAKHFILDSAAGPETTTLTYDWDRVRLLGSQGNLPISLNNLTIGEAAFPKRAVVAGTPFEDQQMVFNSYQVKYNDGRYVIIDTALDETMFKEMADDAPFYQGNYDKMQKALVGAWKIVVTHEHPDHIGGIAKSPFFNEILPHLVISAEQKSSEAELEESGFTKERIGLLTPISYEDYYSPTPGIVLIKAPGHSKGSQMIYVKLQNGNEFLFVGDIGWSMENIEKVTGKALLVNLLFLKEDRSQVGAQLRVLHDLAYVKKDKMHIVVAHDAAQLHDYIQQGLIKDGFE